VKDCLLIASLLILVSCSLSKKTKSTDVAIILEEDDKKGIVLVRKSDCITCHSENEKLIGPAFKDIAERYPATKNNLSKLSEKIITGGSGSWGKLPMTRHADLTKTEAETIVKYIFLLKQ
jgi:cytochrome c